MSAITKVPAAKVGTVVQDFVDEGKTQVTAVKDAGAAATWTVTGRPDDDDDK